MSRASILNARPSADADGSDLTAADARRVCEIDLCERFVIGRADGFAVVRIEIFIDRLNDLQLIQIRQLKKSIEYYRNVFVHMGSFPSSRRLYLPNRNDVFEFTDRFVARDERQFSH